MTAAASSARMAVLRSALIFSPFLALSLLALVYVASSLVDEGASLGGVVGVSLLGFVTLLFAYQVVQSVRDLFSQTVETIGLVARQWSRNEFFLFKNGYIFVENNVFRLEPEEYIRIKLGDTVRVVHYPHTSTVVSAEVTRQRGAE